MREAARGLGVGAEERIARDLVPVPAIAFDREFAHPHQRATNAHGRNDLARDRAGGHPRGGLARRGSPPATIIADAIFGLVDVIGVTRPILFLDVGVVFGSLIDVLDVDRDRRSRRHLPAAAFVEHDARQYAGLVGLAPLRGETRRTRPPTIEIGLDIGGVQGEHRRATVDDAADARAVTFAKGRDPEKMTKTIVRHAAISAVSYGAPPTASNLHLRCAERSAPGRQLVHRKFMLTRRFVIRVETILRTRNGDFAMFKKLAAFGLTAALVLSPMAAFAQAAAPDTTAPAATPAPEKPMKPKHHKKKPHTAKKMEKEPAPPAEAPKT